jgi:HSP90 family molecular chaperone
MSVDDYIKGKETRPCPVDNDAAGNMVVRGLYKNPVVAWREAVSNACDAMRHSDVKMVKVYTNKQGDGIIEDWGTGIEDNDHFWRFIGIGRIRENVSSDVNARDDKEIGRFGVGQKFLPRPFKDQSCAVLQSFK